MTKALGYEVDPYEPINVRQTIKTPADNEIPLQTKPSQAIEKPKRGLDMYICPFCSSIVVDPI